MPEKKRSRSTLLIVLAVLGIFIFFFIVLPIVFLSGGPSSALKSGNVAIIPIKGVITVDGAPAAAFTHETASSQEIVQFIQDAEASPSIKALVFDINSPGGSAVASDEIASAIKKTTKPTIAVIREVGASGGYWVASATDTIIANRMSITGSIGVISSYLEFSELLSKYGVEYQRLVSGKYKDVGSPFKNLTDEEHALLQAKINKIHTYFVEEIAENRNLPKESVATLATGEFFLGAEAKELGLVDQLGDLETAKALLQQQLNVTEITFSSYERQPSLFDFFSASISGYFFSIGQGIGSVFVQQEYGIQAR